MAPRDSKPTSTEEARFRRSLDGSIAGRLVARAPLPPVIAPSLEGLVAQVREPELPTQDEVTQAFVDEVLARSPRIDRPAGEPVAMGDELTLDLVGFAQGSILPDFIQEAVRFVLEPDSVMPGFGARLAGTPVGATVTIDTSLPDDYPYPPLRQAAGKFVVRIRQAAHVEPPPGNFESAEVLRAVGLPARLEEALEQIVDQLVDERRLAQQQAALRQIQEVLIQRAKIEVPEVSVDAAIGVLWSDAQGRFLLSLGARPADRDLSAAAWLENAPLREVVRHRIQVTALMVALAREHGLNQLSQSELEDYVASLAEPAGLDPQASVQLLQVDHAFALQMGDQLVYLKTAELLLQAAEIRTAPPTESAAPR